MKLSDYAKKNNIHYMTAYRWFKSGKLPVPAYQTASGTIMVEDVPEDANNQAVSDLIKKTVELSSTNASVEDLTSYVVSNYKLIPNNHIITNNITSQVSLEDAKNLINMCYNNEQNNTFTSTHIDDICKLNYNTFEMIMNTIKGINDI